MRRTARSAILATTVLLFCGQPYPIQAQEASVWVFQDKFVGPETDPLYSVFNQFANFLEGSLANASTCRTVLGPGLLRERLSTVRQDAVDNAATNDEIQQAIRDSVSGLDKTDEAASLRITALDDGSGYVVSAVLMEAPAGFSLASAVRVVRTSNQVFTAIDEVANEIAPGEICQAAWHGTITYTEQKEEKDPTYRTAIGDGSFVSREASRGSSKTITITANGAPTWTGTGETHLKNVETTTGDSTCLTQDQRTLLGIFKFTNTQTDELVTRGSGHGTADLSVTLKSDGVYTITVRSLSDFGDATATQSQTYSYSSNCPDAVFPGKDSSITQPAGISLNFLASATATGEDGATRLHDSTGIVVDGGSGQLSWDLSRE